MATTRCEDGQHRASPGTGAPGPLTGQRGKLSPGVVVGQKSGGEQQMSVPAPPKNALFSTEKKM
jgi:hypothetical protein